MRRRSSRPSLRGTLVPVILLSCGLLVGGCANSSSGRPPGSADVLPTGLVGPVAPTPGPGALRYVALGDSYTYGDGVQQSDRWPNQLVRILRPDVDMEVAANLSGRSSASADVIENQLPQLVQLEPQFVSVQVGANDVFFGDPEAYAANIATILDTVLDRVHRADRVVVLTAPDFMLTPDGPSLVDDPVAVSARIKELNGLLRQAAAARGIAVVDISPISDRVREDPSLVGLDPVTGRYLHPSSKQYAGWADLVAERVRRLFAATPSPSAAALKRETDEVPASAPAGSVSP